MADIHLHLHINLGGYGPDDTLRRLVEDASRRGFSLSGHPAAPRPARAAQPSLPFPEPAAPKALPPAPRPHAGPRKKGRPAKAEETAALEARQSLESNVIDAVNMRGAYSINAIGKLPGPTGHPLKWHKANRIVTALCETGELRRVYGRTPEEMRIHTPGQVAHLVEAGHAQDDGGKATWVNGVKLPEMGEPDDNGGES